MKKLLSIISLALATSWFLASPALAETPTDYVRGIMNTVMGIQTDPALSTQDRSRAIHQIIEKNFDFGLMAKDSLGPVYGSLSAGQRHEFTNIFSYLFQDSYTRLVLNFLKRENVEYQKETRNNGNAKVDTVIVRTNEAIPVTYLMHPASQGWVLYDVIVDGVSILANYKTEFARVIRTKSFHFLLDKMKEQRRGIS
jgi:phospholipid transport system substrate-binding protein